MSRKVKVTNGMGEDILFYNYGDASVSAHIIAIPAGATIETIDGDGGGGFDAVGETKSATGSFLGADVLMLTADSGGSSEQYIFDGYVSDYLDGFAVGLVLACAILSLRIVKLIRGV